MKSDKYLSGNFGLNPTRCLIMTLPSTEFMLLYVSTSRSEAPNVRLNSNVRKEPSFEKERYDVS